jgi:hypothetical protein
LRKVAATGILRAVSRNGYPAVSSIILERYRVFGKRREVTVRPLTLLAGANSSGKTSAMHALLLLKQTLDAPFDPGPLLLSGDHVALTSFDDIRSRGRSGAVVFGVTTRDGMRAEFAFSRSTPKAEIEIQQTSRGTKGPEARLTTAGVWHGKRVARVRFMLGSPATRQGVVVLPPSTARAVRALEGILHVPGLRSPPQRDYPVTALGETLPGRFDRYVASLVLAWQERKDGRLAEVEGDLAKLGLTWKVHAERRGDTHVALEVGRLPRAKRGGARDWVALADVGVGVSQALPVVLALRAAQPGQLVYIEQPELHLHPLAEGLLSGMLVAAAKRGVRVVAETHSSLVLRSVQAAIASGDISSEDVALNWFERDVNGEADVRLAEVDEEGAFGDWPVDFGTVELQVEQGYLDAAEKARSA